VTPRPVLLPVVAPAESVSASLPFDLAHDLGLVLNVAHPASWAVRADVLRDALLPVSAAADEDAEALQLLASRRLVTSLLEQFRERELTDVGQAVFYRLAVHPAWQAAAMDFLTAVDPAVMDAWYDANPGIAWWSGRIMARELAYAHHAGPTVH
jgi:hypothetical protein